MKADTTKKSGPAGAPEKALTTKLKDALSRDLPPVSGIYKIFDDLVARAIEGGLEEALHHLRGTGLRVATMCSGTESPLLALRLTARSLKRLGKTPLRVEHEFSAEIEPFKQGYIERNFSPPILYRDIRELSKEDAVTSGATTAYGAVVPVPDGVDLLVAGTSCVDFSTLNTRQKDLDDEGESGATFFAMLAYVKRWQPAIVILENVASAAWTKMKKAFQEIDYDAAHVKVDTKLYYLPQTRVRAYMLCVNRSKLPDSADVVEEWVSSMKAFQRPVSSSLTSFMLPDDDPRIQQARIVVKKERGKLREWKASRIRHTNFRSFQGLGDKRPLTQWVDGGICHPPEYTDRKWFLKEVERVWDVMEMLYLKHALDRHGGFDVQYKTKMWNLSQNIDMSCESNDLGIASCLTPDGKPFVLSRGGPLTGYDTLALQGIPVDEISFTTETEGQMQDLAGNAMSSTVVGSAILQALIVAHKAIDLREDRNNATESEAVVNSIKQMYKEKLQKYSQKEDQAKRIVNIPQLLQHAGNTSWRCACEGQLMNTTKPVSRCKRCSHSACKVCAGFPEHEYGEPAKLERPAPSTFEAEWRRFFPVRVRFVGRPDFPKLFAGQTQTSKALAIETKYIAAVSEALEGIFTLQRFRRGNKWTVSYESSQAKLRLVLEQPLEWELFVTADPALPAKHDLRSILEHPVAKSRVIGKHATIFSTDGWSWFTPRPLTLATNFRCSTKMVPSWRARLGLVDHLDEQVPPQITILISQMEAEVIGEDLSGVYNLRQLCGTACSSLYIRTDCFLDHGLSPMCLFLDPSLTGLPKHDYFVFSRNHERVALDEQRKVVARLQPEWRNWTATEFKKVRIDLPGSWTPGSKLTQVEQFVEDVLYFKPGQPWSVSISTDGCYNATTVFLCEFSADEADREYLASKLSVALSDRAFFKRFSWALEAGTKIPTLGFWQNITDQIVSHDSDLGRCECCAPVLPMTKWRLKEPKKTKAPKKPKKSPRDEKIASVAIPYEDQKDATTFEKAFKKRPDALSLQVGFKKSEVSLSLGINLASMAHRAHAQLGLVGSTGTSLVEWKLDTRYIAPIAGNFPRFTLRNNDQDTPHPLISEMSQPLRSEQLRSLAWMRSRESSDPVPFTLEAIEEAHLPHLKWRAEVRVQHEVKIKGGIVADHVGFGKTATTLAMIEAEFLEKSTEAIVDELEAAYGSYFVNVAATLVICDSKLVNQWAKAVEKFLNKSRYVRDKDVLVLRSWAQLEKLKIKDFKDAKIIIISWALLNNDSGYLQKLAEFVASPRPVFPSGRSYGAWLDYVLTKVPGRLDELQKYGVQTFEKLQSIRKTEIDENPEFFAAAPSKRLKGSAFKPEIAAASAKAQPKDQKSEAYSASISDKQCREDWEKFSVPLFQLFRFNRVVIDEFTYADSDQSSSSAPMIRIKADKRWILSGTPPLGDFYDVQNKMAPFLGVNLGPEVYAPLVISQRNLKSMADDLIEVEKFRSTCEVKTLTWHESRHGYAQSFLNFFVRQNEPRIDEIKLCEVLIPVELDIAHRIFHGELVQYLRSSNMQVAKADEMGEREDEINKAVDSLNKAEHKSAEAVLQNCAAYKTNHKNVADLVQIRKVELRKVEQVLSSKLIGVLRTVNSGLDEQDRVGKFTKPVMEMKATKDPDAGRTLYRLLDEAKHNPKSQKPSKELSYECRKRINNLDALTRQLEMQQKSLRYFENATELLRSKSNPTQAPPTCQSHDCMGNDAVAIIATCGHVACKTCIEDPDRSSRHCIVKDCQTPMSKANIEWIQNLVASNVSRVETGRGAKFNKIVDLIEKLPKDDQALVFVQNDSMMEHLGKIFNQHGIRHSAIKGNNQQVDQLVDDFQENQDPSKRKKVLILNLSNSSAAGLNLQNANHVIFVSPLLATTQYQHDSSMKQAIGRSRRQGQKKTVFVYRFVALNTIDVNILLQREYRSEPLLEFIQDVDALPTAESKQEAGKGERTKLVAREDGRLALVPESHEWAEAGEDEADRNFSCPVMWSEEFMDDDDE
ncbi:hypothetical protein K402DRAFT_404904 [Aulographum hederae CBS 113979]|uniref:Helicase C-terminal domain-containing protein n=1 Tax=Aulographum hederae CBS 113979 TaxID=1176131 RepID=A0A6G1GYA6_9PEZI|nr:hypothetical protein K402DRAFT_404904 [Aulographum hederae CBS 113979]